MRKVLTLFALLLLACPYAQAAGAKLYLVKVISFDCAVCRAAQAIDGAVEQAARRAGARVVYAPLPREHTDIREQFFYAMQGMGLHTKVLQALFSGTQGLGYPLKTESEVMDWLSSELSADHVDWRVVLRRIDDGEAEEDVKKAIILAYKAGVTRYPTYVFVKNNQILAVIDISTAGGSISQLRAAVVAKLRQITHINVG